MYKICNFGLSESLNPRLYSKVSENILSGERGSDHITGRCTRMNLHKLEIKEVDLLINWIETLLPSLSTIFAARDKVDNYAYDPRYLKITDCWGVIYNKGESLKEHNHFPFTISFVYYVRLPQGSSPLIIENKKVKMEEGDCIFFLGSDYHRVNRNKCDGRCIIGGNILYSP